MFFVCYWYYAHFSECAYCGHFFRSIAFGNMITKANRRIIVKEKNYILSLILIVL